MIKEWFSGEFSRSSMTDVSIGRLPKLSFYMYVKCKICQSESAMPDWSPIPVQMMTHGEVLFSTTHDDHDTVVDLRPRPMVTACSSGGNWSWSLEFLGPGF